MVDALQPWNVKPQKNKSSIRSNGNILYFLSIDRLVFLNISNGHKRVAQKPSKMPSPSAPSCLLSCCHYDVMKYTHVGTKRIILQAITSGLPCPQVSMG